MAMHGEGTARNGPPFDAKFPLLLVVATFKQHRVAHMT